ncbi:unnamed protein product, partial [Nesidiocoris tenuis]
MATLIDKIAKRQHCRFESVIHCPALPHIGWSIGTRYHGSGVYHGIMEYHGMWSIVVPG